MAKLNLTALKKQNLSQIVETPPEKIVPSEPESFRAKVSLTQFKREREVKETPSVGTISPVTALSEESISKETTSDITTNEKGANSDIPETPVSVSLEIPNNTPSPKEVLPTREFFPNLAVAQDDMFKDLAGDVLNWGEAPAQVWEESLSKESAPLEVIASEEPTPVEMITEVETQPIETPPTTHIEEVSVVSSTTSELPEETFVEEAPQKEYVQQVAETLSEDRPGWLSQLFSKEKRILMGSLIGVTTLCVTGVVLFASGILTPGKTSVLESVPPPGGVIAMSTGSTHTGNVITDVGMTATGTTATGSVSLSGSTQTGGVVASGSITPTQTGALISSGSTAMTGTGGIPSTLSQTGSTLSGGITPTKTGTGGIVLVQTGSTVSGAILPPKTGSGLTSIVPTGSGTLTSSTSVNSFRTPNIPKKR